MSDYEVYERERQQSSLREFPSYTAWSARRVMPAEPRPAAPDSARVAAFVENAMKSTPGVEQLSERDRETAKWALTGAAEAAWAYTAKLRDALADIKRTADAAVAGADGPMVALLEISNHVREVLRDAR